MRRLLIDTNIWIDLAGNFKEQPLLLVLEELVRDNKAELIVPSIVKKEFEAKREGTEKVAAQRASSAFTSAKSVVDLLGTSEDKTRFRDLLSDMGQKYPLMGEVPKFYVSRVKALLDTGTQVEPSGDVLIRAARRAMERRGPCHGTKNSINDAVLIEMYADLLKNGAAEDVFAFVSRNHSDFSAPGESHKTPHPDIVEHFKYPSSWYFITLPEALEEVAPEELEEANYQTSGQPEPRTFSEISDAIDLLWDQVWYNRHKAREEKIADGTIELGRFERAGGHVRTRRRGQKAVDDDARSHETGRGEARVGGPGAVYRFRMGDAQRQVLGAPLGAWGRVGLPRHLICCAKSS